MLHGHIKGAAGAIYFTLYATRAQYVIILPYRAIWNILPGGKILANIVSHTFFCVTLTFQGQKMEGVGTDLCSQPYQVGHT